MALIGSGPAPACRRTVRSLLTIEATAPLASKGTSSPHSASWRRSIEVGRRAFVFVDGGVTMYNNPAFQLFLMATLDAYRLGWPATESDLLLAYDDPLGVTAAFNRNLLVRINRELGGNFDVDAFGHRAVWNRRESRVEMHLVSRRGQRVRITAARVDVAMKEGDTIWTESSYKYGHDEIEVLLERAGFHPVERWLAGEERFLLTLARAK